MSKHGTTVTILSSLPFLWVGVVVFAMGGPLIVGFVLLMWGLGGIIYGILGMLGIGRRD